MFHNNNMNNHKAVSIPDSCQEDIFNNGHTVFVLSGWEKDKIEEWVKEVASHSGEKVDWHYSGGKANILGLGDLEKIRNTIKEMLPALNKQINEFYKKKEGFFQSTNYTTKDVDRWNNKEMYRSCFLNNSF